MTKYQTLVNILDVIRKEAPENYKFYHPLESQVEDLNKARSRALIHLFLKVKFGLLTFEDREKFVTDGVYDGGIDGYFIDYEKKRIYFIQSKFRDNADNFMSREIKFEDLINMEIDRITEGETAHENGTKYNEKIQKLIKEIQKISDIGRFKYEIIVIANTKNISQNNLRKLTDGNIVLEYNYERVYNDLIFPIVSGTYYDQSELILEINLANKTSEDISYSVETEFTDCEISALFVPTIEIAKSLYKYKNSILKYNPRSYLEMYGGTVNSEIAKTITNKKTNEFALFNNGITMLSDDTDLNKKISKKGKGQLIITNPQIINGGQTAFTLSRIYEDILSTHNDFSVFDNKEVLLKVITFDNNQKDENGQKLKLIEAISKATNQQTAISEADRRSNDKVQIDLQALIYKEYGLFYQRKAGEFGEGLKNRYIDRKVIIDRELLLRLILASNLEPSQARRIGGNPLFTKSNFDRILNDASKFKEYVFAYKIYEELSNIQASYKADYSNKDGIINYGYALRYGRFAVVSAIMNNYAKIKKLEISYIVEKILSEWLNFEDKIVKSKKNYNYFREIVDEENNTVRQILNFDGYYKGNTLNSEIKEYQFNLFKVS